MRIFKNFIRNFKSIDHSLPLGRWNKESSQLTFIKVDLSNEDHCGTCTNFTKHNLKNNLKNNNENYYYYMIVDSHSK